MAITLNLSMSGPGSEVANAAEARITLESEAQTITAWAERRGWDVTIDLEALTILAIAAHPALPDIKVRFRADVSNYRTHPPTWRCVDEFGESPNSAFPTPGPVTNGPASSVFHPGAFICAPWSALAYSENAGPHGDWGALSNWLNAPASNSQAQTIADMLSTLALHLDASPGMLP